MKPEKISFPVPVTNPVGTRIPRHMRPIETVKTDHVFRTAPFDELDYKIDTRRKPTSR